MTASPRARAETIAREIAQQWDRWKNSVSPHVSNGVFGYPQLQELIAAAIQSAVEQERERVVKVVESEEIPNPANAPDAINLCQPADVAVAATRATIRSIVERIRAALRDNDG